MGTWVLINARWYKQRNGVESTPAGCKRLTGIRVDRPALGFVSGFSSLT